MKIGYARISTPDQKTDPQEDLLRAAGCEKVITDQVSGAAEKRPKLDQLLGALRPGDELIVWRLDRLGRSMLHLLNTIQAIEAKGAEFRSLHENIDTTTAGGRLMYHIMGALAEFERSLIAERTKVGLAAAKRRGQRLGRRKSLSKAQIDHARKLIADGERPADVARSFKVARSTLYRAIQ